MKRNGKKSARKSVVGKPFQSGHDPRRGHGPPPGSGGRPPDRIRQLAANIVERDHLIEVLAGIAVNKQSKGADRVAAAKLLLAYADAYINPDNPIGSETQSLVIRVIHDRKL